MALTNLVYIQVYLSEWEIIKIREGSFGPGSSKEFAVYFPQVSKHTGSCIVPQAMGIFSDTTTANQPLTSKPTFLSKTKFSKTGGFPAHPEPAPAHLLQQLVLPPLTLGLQPVERLPDVVYLILHQLHRVYLVLDGDHVPLHLAHVSLARLYAARGAF